MSSVDGRSGTRGKVVEVESRLLWTGYQGAQRRLRQTSGQFTSLRSRRGQRGSKCCSSFPQIFLNVGAEVGDLQKQQDRLVGVERGEISFDHRD